MARKDGRAPDQLRPVTITMGWQQTAFASALVELGRTKVVCAVSYEDRVPPFLRGSGKGWVTSEYAMLPGATGERSGREVSKGRPGGRTHEIQRLIGRSLRAVTDTQAFGESTLWVDCDVLQADGGTRCASITGAWVALFAASHRLMEEKRVKSFPLRDHVAAVSVGMVDGTPCLDLAQPGHEALEGGVLGEEASRSGLDSGKQVLDRLRRGEQHDSCRRDLRRDRRHYLEARHAGHEDIEKDDVGLVFFRQADGRHGVAGGGNYLESSVFDGGGEGGAKQFGVVDDENGALHKAFTTARSGPVARPGAGRERSGGRWRRCGRRRTSDRACPSGGRLLR